MYEDSVSPAKYVSLRLLLFSVSLRYSAADHVKWKLKIYLWLVTVQTLLLMR